MKSLKIYQIPLWNKVKRIFESYEFGIPVQVSLKDAKFVIINDFADKIILMCDKDTNENQDFFFNLNLEPEKVNDLRIFLSKQKNFIFKYITSKDYFINSHIYQLLLQYIPYELTDVEKSVFLDAYINMTTDLRGSVIADEKRKRLEKNLNINQR